MARAVLGSWGLCDGCPAVFNGGDTSAVGLDCSRRCRYNARMKRHTTSIALTAILIPSVCFAWGRDGHRITGYIAEKLLTPQARAAIRDLLGNESLADASTWADEIRRKRKNTEPWHYVNVDPSRDRIDLDCPEQGCVVSAIIKYSHVLRDKNASRQDRIEALKFVVHFVGDIHQPLHVSHARDRGGNDIKVTFFENRTNLHSFWDSGMIRRTKKRWSEYATELAANITPQQRIRYGTLDPVAWATESYQLARSNAYTIPKDGRIGQDYFERNLPVVEQRLTMSGVRLAALLNAIFDEDKETMADDPG